MNIRDLEYFNQLAQLHSFTSVAKHFRVSQPTITYAIKRLEAHFQCDLIQKDPSHRTVALTLQGELLAKHAESILEELAVAEKEMERLNHKEVKVGFPPIIRARVLSKFIEKQFDLDFMTSLNFTSTGSNDLFHSLITGDLDFSLIGSLQTLDHPKLVTRELYQKKFYIVLSENHPLASRKELSFKEVLDEKFILLDEKHTHLDAFSRLNEQYHNAAQVLFYFSEPSMIGQMVRENMGIALLTDFVLFSQLDGLAMVPLTDEAQPTFHVGYAYPKEMVLTPQLQTFIENLESIRDDL